VFARRYVNGESKDRGGAGVFISNLVPVLSVFFIGYPLGRATIRTMLIGWFLVIVAVTQFILRRYFQRAGSAVAARTATLRSTDRGSSQS
jgi:hypothetical protein